MINYEDRLLRYLTEIKESQGFDDIDIEISTEQSFAKKKTFKPNTMYVIIKFLQSDITYSAITKPLNIVTICEQNNLDRCRTILDIFTTSYNYNTFTNTEGTRTDLYKQQYSTPVVVSNFEEIGYGYRSVLYCTGALIVLEGMLDIKDVKIDNVSITPTNFTISYQMTPNTQQQAQETLASSMKSSAVLSLSMSIPFVENAIIEKVLKTMSMAKNEQQEIIYKGNENYAISFKYGNTEFTTFNYKMTSASIGSTPDDLPVLNLGFIR